MRALRARVCGAGRHRKLFVAESLGMSGIGCDGVRRKRGSHHRPATGRHWLAWVTAFRVTKLSTTKFIPSRCQGISALCQPGPPNSWLVMSRHDENSNRKSSRTCSTNLDIDATIMPKQRNQTPTQAAMLLHTAKETKQNPLSQYRHAR